MKCKWNKCANEALPEMTAVPNPDGNGTRPEPLCERHRKAVKVGLEMIAHIDEAMAAAKKLLEKGRAP